MKKDLDPLIEEKWRKQYKFVTFIAATEKLPNNKEIKITLYQGNGFINMYKTFFENNYARWMNDIMPL